MIDQRLSVVGRVALLGNVAAVAACGGSDLALPNGEPAVIEVAAGEGQTGTVGTPLTDSLVVRVTDSNGAGVRGITVTWGPNGSGSVSPAASTTDAAGRAATQRMLGDEPGAYTTSASADVVEGSPVIFTATGITGPTPRLVFVAQPSASALKGAVFDRQPILQLQDPAGNALAQANVAVTAQIATGGGTLNGTTARSSDGNGRITFTDLAIQGDPGPRTLIFAANGFAPATSAPVSITIGAPAAIAATAGQDQTAPAGGAVAVRPAVLVRDFAGNPIPGAAVTFSVKAGGGSVTGASRTTDAAGVAEVGSWTLGATMGTNRLEARVAGASVSGNPVTFTATSTPDAPSTDRSTISASPSSLQASAGGNASTVTVTVRDRHGNAVPGVTVVLSATGAGNGLTQPSATTDASGKAVGRFSSTEAAAHVVSATADGSKISQTASITVSPAGVDPSHSHATVPNGTAGVATTVTIQLRDQFDNPVPGAGSQLDVGVDGANSASGLSIAGGSGGEYTASYTPTKAGIDFVHVRVTGTDVPGSPFTSVVSPGPADASKSVATVPETASAFLAVPVAVAVRDAFDNPLGRGGDVVTVTVVSGSNRSVVSMTDNGDGTYSAQFGPLGTGTYSIEIAVNGAPVAGSPFTLRVRLL